MNLQRTHQRACHVQVRDVARAAAGEMYESLMSNNHYREMWKQQNPGCNEKQLIKRFIDRNWPQFIDFARSTLTVMLTKDDISDTMKDQIMDVLEKDQSLRFRVGRRSH